MKVILLNLDREHKMNFDLLYKQTEKLAFYQQPIFSIEPDAIKKRKINSYELLLRNINGVDSFPLEVFKSFLTNNDTNRIFWNWARQKLRAIITRYPTTNFSINIDPQQLYYESTFDFLENMKYCNDHLMIEITETLPFSRPLDNYYNYDLTQKIKTIYKMGYKIAVDDVSNGMNSVSMVKKYAPYIKRIKLSLFQLKFNDCKIERSLIVMWGSIAQYLDLEIVIEGIDTLSTNVWIANNIFCLQQGFFLSIPGEIGKITY